MPHPAPPRALHTVEFHRTKYGRELLVDAAWVHEMPSFVPGVTRPHVNDFYDILLVTRGHGTYTLDGVRSSVAPGSLLLSAPGEARHLQARGLDGACLFFTEEFVREAFSDARLLDGMAFFRPDRPQGWLTLDANERRRFLARFSEMRREIAAARDDTMHALRASLYETLVMLNRWYVAHVGPPAPEIPAGVVERFRRMVETDFSRRHRVADYARQLGVSAGHLNALCRTRLRRRAGDCIRARITLEARRLLAYTDLTAAEVAFRIGFEDPAYFARFFRREVGDSPSGFRAGRRLVVGSTRTGRTAVRR